MARTHSIIPPFPDDIDRVAFGHWLSGFADGEGCFSLAIDTTHERKIPLPVAGFFLKLRADDSNILSLIQSFWGGGTLSFIGRRPDSRGLKGQPTCAFQARRVSFLHDVLIPHFLKYPLRAKKAADFAIWTQGIRLYHEVASRKRISIGAGQGRIRGTLTRWTMEERNHFFALVELLAANRRFR